jgi:hypothetical protein
VHRCARIMPARCQIVTIQLQLTDNSMEAIDMKKPQAIKFWKSLADSTSVNDVISSFEFKKGYGGRRTLVRYSQAADGFKIDLSLEEVAKKTGWSIAYVEQIHIWWQEDFPGVETSQSRSAVEHGVEISKKFEGIMNEFESEKASLNRGRIRNMAAKSESVLKIAVDAARNAEHANKKRDAFNGLELDGLAIAETVASFEKMATFLVGDGRLQDMFKPWFWQTVLDCWISLKIWVNFRLTTSDNKYHLAGFGQGFKQLAGIAKQRLGNDALKYTID